MMFDQLFDIKTCIVYSLIGLITFYLSKLYLQVWNLPPGPIPWPFIGNLGLLRGTKNHTAIEFTKLSKKYGPVFTFWMGSTPWVFLNEFKSTKEAFKKNELSGRPKTMVGSWFTNEESTEIFFSDYGPRWESLRRVLHAAVRKYSNHENLPHLTSQIVEETVKTIIEKEGVDKPIYIDKYVLLIFCNIMATSAFGKRYTIDDPEFNLIKYIGSDLFKEMGSTLPILEFVPFLRPFYGSTLAHFKSKIHEINDLLRGKLDEHKKTFDENNIRDFCDSMISAKNEAIAESKESLPYLTDANLGWVLQDFFLAGMDTSHLTFKWMLCLLAYYPDMQKKLRKEVEEVIGDRIPVLEDRNNCHYISAFIIETLRFMPIAPISATHRSLIDTEIGGHYIPKDTTVSPNLYAIMRDEKLYPNPNVFNPDRFLNENGESIVGDVRSSGFVPFSVGRRACPGEKLAMADLFLVLIKFLQVTSDYEIVFEDNLNKSKLEPDEIIADMMAPKKSAFIFKKIK